MAKTTAIEIPCPAIYENSINLRSTKSGPTILITIENPILKLK